MLHMFRRSSMFLGIVFLLLLTFIIYSQYVYASDKNPPVNPVNQHSNSFKPDQSQSATSFSEDFIISQNISDNLLVNNDTTGFQSVPAITYGPDGQVYIAWANCSDFDENEGSCNCNPDIYFAKSADGGQSFGNSISVNDVIEDAYCNQPAMVTDAAGNIYIVWHDNRDGYDKSWDIYFAKSTDGGDTFSTNAIVSAHKEGVTQYEPSLAVDSSGTNVYVSWTRLYRDNDNERWDYDIYFAKSTDSGANFSTPVQVDDGTDWQYKSDIAVGASGNVYIVWTDRRNNGISDVYFTKSTDGGTTFSDNTCVNDYQDYSQGYPAIVLDDTENIYVVWNDSRRYYSDSLIDVYLTCSTDRGETFADGTKVNDADIANSIKYLYPSITTYGRGNIGVSWNDTRTGNLDIYLTRSTDSGSSFEPSWKVNDDDTTEDQSAPAIIAGPSGNIYCAWRDARSDAGDIYFAIDTIGQTDPVLSVDEGTVGTEFTITGAGFGDKKGEVFLLYETNGKTKKKRCKVLEWNNTSVRCRIKKSIKIPPVICDVKIRRKGSIESPIILENVFSIMPPDLESVSPDNAVAKTHVTISGSYFGSKRGRVFLEYRKNDKPKKKRCKVFDWTMDSETGVSSITFKVPKRLSPGIYDVRVKNRVGSDTLTEEFTITED
ncbi:MAG: hypothetical protein B1H11_09755 [Desulfobacteraceae bacterium 4484_190.1]|nr:MAG: hypothetical protein B1H11_09755 [Desulfobacteraceae bacterium 4484_190.1]